MVAHEPGRGIPMHLHWKVSPGQLDQSGVDCRWAMDPVDADYIVLRDGGFARMWRALLEAGDDD
jgi:hypothetical protein